MVPIFNLIDIYHNSGIGCCLYFGRKIYNIFVECVADFKDLTDELESSKRAHSRDCLMHNNSLIQSQKLYAKKCVEIERGGGNVVRFTSDK